MIHRFIKDHEGEFSVGAMCRVLEVSASGYYCRQARPESRRAGENRRLLVHIKAAHQRSKKTYGSPRVHAELAAQGICCGKKRVAGLMSENGLRAKQRKRFKATTDSAHPHPTAANLLDQNFTCEGPNEVWASDISYIPTQEGWLYLAVVMDLYSRMIVGWALRARLTKDLALDALKMAIRRRSPAPGLVHHSDRGSQYASGDYRALLQKQGMICSMSRKGNCFDNAPVESLFHTIKVEHSRSALQNEGRGQTRSLRVHRGLL